MICKNCNTEFNTSRIKPGESVTCPCCGKVYQRKADTSSQTVRAPQKDAAKRKAKAAKVKKRSAAGSIALLGIVAFLSLVAIAGIATHRFAPTVFHKVTFGVFVKNSEAQEKGPYVLKSYTYSQYERSGDEYTNSTEYRYTENGLVEEEHLSTKGFGGTIYEYSYAYNDQGYPVSVIRTDSSTGYSVSINVDPVLDEENVLNLYYLDDSMNTVSYDFYSQSRLFKNANIYCDNTVKKYRNGEQVYYYELIGTREQERSVEWLPDGTRVESKSYADTEQTGSKKRIAMAFDASGILLYLACYQTEQQTGYAAVSYFREKNATETGFVLHGIVTEASGLLKSLIGGDIVRYIYSDDDALVREDKYVIAAVGAENGWLLREKPARQITYSSGGTVILDELFYYSDDGFLVTKESFVFAPLSDVSDVTQPVSEAADTDRTELISEASVKETNATAADSSGHEQAARETEAPISAATPAPTAAPTATLAPTATPKPKPTATPTPKPTATPKPRAATILHCNNAANVRSGPNSGSEKLGSLSWGKRVTVIGQVGDWFMIEYKGGVAYVFSEYVAVHHTGTIVKVNNRVTVRIEPDEESERLGAINKGKTVEVIEIEGEWAMIVYKDAENGIAYIHSKFVQLDD